MSALSALRIAQLGSRNLVRGPSTASQTVKGMRSGREEEAALSKEGPEEVDLKARPLRRRWCGGRSKSNMTGIHRCSQGHRRHGRCGRHAASDGAVLSSLAAGVRCIRATRLSLSSTKRGADCECRASCILVAKNHAEKASVKGFAQAPCKGCRA